VELVKLRKLQLSIQLDQKTPASLRTEGVEERQQKKYQDLKRKPTDTESRKNDILD